MYRTLQHVRDIKCRFEGCFRHVSWCLFDAVLLIAHTDSTVHINWDVDVITQSEPSKGQVQFRWVLIHIISHTIYVSLSQICIYPVSYVSELKEDCIEVV